MITKKHKIVEVGNYLYILSDDEIKEGDWCYEKRASKLANEPFSKNMEYDGVKFKDIPGAMVHINIAFSKIIATNDPKLQVDNILDVTLEKFGKKHLPQIPKSLIKYYKVYLPNEVKLEYDCQVKAINYGTDKEPHKVKNYDDWTTVGVFSSYGLLGVERRETLKLQNNEVVWGGSIEPVSVDAKMYTSEEVKNKIEEYREFAFMNGLTIVSKKEWIKENL